MNESYDEIFNAALSLAPGSRAMLAEHLLESLSPQNQKEIDARWAEEAEKRAKEVKEGTVQPISSQEVFQKLRSKAK